MPYVDTLPSKPEIFTFWSDRFPEIGIFVDWGEPSCWACGLHYGTKYDIKSPDAPWATLLKGWEQIPLQRCHIVPRSLGGTDEPSNLFLMCRECHDLAPNTSMPEIFFEWVRAQSYWNRDATRMEEALRCFGIEEQRPDIERILQAADFREWAKNKFSLHRPQSRYAGVSARLTSATLAGLIAHYLRREKAAQTPR